MKTLQERWNQSRIDMMPSPPPRGTIDTDDREGIRLHIRLLSEGLVDLDKREVVLRERHAFLSRMCTPVEVVKRMSHRQDTVKAKKRFVRTHPLAQAERDLSALEHKRSAMRHQLQYWETKLERAA